MLISFSYLVMLSLGWLSCCWVVWLGASCLGAKKTFWVFLGFVRMLF